MDLPAVKFTAIVHGSPAPLKRGEPHLVIPAAVRLLEQHPSYTVAIRRTDVVVGHSHHLRHRDGVWSLQLNPSTVWPAKPAAEKEEQEEIHQVLTNLGITVTNQESRT